MDQRLMLLFGCGLNALALVMMSDLSLGMDYWSLALPRFMQGFAQGFIFVPLQTLALATIRLDRLSNATAAYNVVRNVGGSVGVAFITSLLARRAQYHQTVLAGHVTQWSPETAGRLSEWASHFAQKGFDSFTAARQATSMLYQEMIGQAQVLTYADEFWLLALVFMAVLPLLPLLRRVRAEENEQARAAAPARETGSPSSPGDVGTVPDAID
jgi:DHA2 family multidrug resistance protein